MIDLFIIAFLDPYTVAIGPEKAVRPIEDMQGVIHPGHSECVLWALRESLAYAEEITVELTEAGEARITIDRVPILVVADIALDNGLCEQPTPQLYTWNHK